MECSGCEGIRAEVKCVKKKLIAAFLYIIFFGSILIVAAYYFYYYRNQRKSDKLFSQIEQEVEKQQIELHKVAKEQIVKSQKKDKEKEHIENAVLQLGALQKKNKDIYGWIEIPDTKVNYPILQNEKENYYLMHNLDHSTGYPGCIYTNVINRKTFTDAITVLYGHNMKNETMFGSLYHFREESYFKKHEYIYIYTKETVRVYKITAVCEWKNINLFQKYKPDSQKDKKQFLEQMKKSRPIQFRDVKWKKNKNILVLSTCVRGKSQKRLLIAAIEI